MKLGWILCFLFLSYSAQADMTPEILSPSEDEVVIEDGWMSDVTLEDPVFSPRKKERNLAAMTQEDSLFQESDFSGELSVQTEIPYSYPSISRLTIESRVLAEIEAKEKKTK